MSKIVYPLEQVLEVKKRRVEDAERVVREKKEILKNEQKKLEERKKERDKVLQHHKDKLAQLRHEMDTATTSPKIQQMKSYLKVVQEKLKVEEKKVADQQGQVNTAEKNVELAQLELIRKRHEVDKLSTHKVDWEKIARKELEIIEGREQDELGTTTYMVHQRQKL